MRVAASLQRNRNGGGSPTVVQRPTGGTWDAFSGDAVKREIYRKFILKVADEMDEEGLEETDPLMEINLALRGLRGKIRSLVVDS